MKHQKQTKCPISNPSALVASLVGLTMAIDTLLLNELTLGNIAETKKEFDKRVAMLPLLAKSGALHSGVLMPRRSRSKVKAPSHGL